MGSTIVLRSAFRFLTNRKKPSLGADASPDASSSGWKGRVFRRAVRATAIFSSLGVQQRAQAIVFPAFFSK